MNILVFFRTVLQFNGFLSDLNKLIYTMANRNTETVKQGQARAYERRDAMTFFYQR